MKGEDKIIIACLVFALIMWIPLFITCINEITHPIAKKQQKDPLQEAYFFKARCESGGYPEDCKKIDWTLIQEAESK